MLVCYHHCRTIIFCDTIFEFAADVDLSINYDNLDKTAKDIPTNTFSDIERVPRQGNGLIGEEDICKSLFDDLPSADIFDDIPVRAVSSRRRVRNSASQRHQRPAPGMVTINF